MPLHKRTHNGGFDHIAANLRKLAKSDVMVGIPARANANKEHPQIGNAALLYLLTNGTLNTPPRPVIEPALKANADLYMPELRQAAFSALEGQDFTEDLDRAGTIAANAAKRWFVDPRNNWPPNAPATIESKGSDKPNIDTGEVRRVITSVTRSNK